MHKTHRLLHIISFESLSTSHYTARSFLSSLKFTIERYVFTIRFGSAAKDGRITDYYLSYCASFPRIIGASC